MMIVFASSLWSSMMGAPDVCPVIDMEEFRHYSKQDVSITYNKEAKLGKNVIDISLSNPKLPSGYMVSAFLDIITVTDSEAFEVVDGYPKTTVTIKEPGEYQFSLGVNLVYRGS